MDLETRYQDVCNRIQNLCIAAGNIPVPRLIAVIKKHPVEKIIALAALGQVWFGENYCDEMQKKATDIKTTTAQVKWSFIGQLQSNKIARIVEITDEIQSGCSEKHFRYINRYVLEMNKNNFPVFILVNAGNEEQKSGCLGAEVQDLVQFIQRDCPALELQGVMAIPPANFIDEAFTTPPEIYLKLRDLADHTGLKKLSLGMTQDLKLAITTRTDVVRIGTQIFGERS